jgi:septum formation protein
MTPRLILASLSPRRSDVLSQLGLDHRVMPADVDEAYLDGEDPAQHVERLARAKAMAISAREPGALVIGGDTVVVDGARVLGKPEHDRAAVEMLVSLAGRDHVVLSGIALAGPHGLASRVSETAVRFRSFSEDAARAYVATEEPLDKAGAYGIQGMGAALVEAIDGDYYSVMGFPIDAFVNVLFEAGWRYDFGSLTPIS